MSGTPSPASSLTDPAFRNLTDDLRLAHLLADDADSITTNRFKALDLHVVAKPDLTPVSDADTAVEEALRRTLGRARPRDAVHGEEMEDTGWGPRRWVIDPIDGTKNFVRGVPVWATLIALMINDEVAVGVVSAPALGRRWWASLGGGAYAGKSLMSATPCRVSDVAADRGRVAELLLDPGLGGVGSRSAVRRPDAGLLAESGVRGLLVLHAARGGRGGHRLRARAGPARHGRLLDRGHRGGWPVHRPGRRSPARAGRTPWPPTAGCTMSSWSSWRSPTTSPDGPFPAALAPGTGRESPGQNDAMQLTHTFEIAAPVDQVFDVFGRLDLLAPCFPGASVWGRDGEVYHGAVKIKFGPFPLVFEGTARVVRADLAERRLVVKANARDRRGAAAGAATVTATFSATGGGQHPGPGRLRSRPDRSPGAAGLRRHLLGQRPAGRPVRRLHRRQAGGRAGGRRDGRQPRRAADQASGGRGLRAGRVAARPLRPEYAYRPPSTSESAPHLQVLPDVARTWLPWAGGAVGGVAVLVLLVRWLRRR